MADDPVDELYGLPPADFVAQRDALARRLRQDGDRERAAEVKALGRADAGGVGGQPARARPPAGDRARCSRPARRSRPPRSSCSTAPTPASCAPRPRPRGALVDALAAEAEADGADARQGARHAACGDGRPGRAGRGRRGAADRRSAPPRASAARGARRGTTGCPGRRPQDGLRAQGDRRRARRHGGAQGQGQGRGGLGEGRRRASRRRPGPTRAWPGGGATRCAGPRRPRPPPRAPWPAPAARSSRSRRRSQARRRDLEDAEAALSAARVRRERAEQAADG